MNFTENSKEKNQDPQNYFDMSINKKYIAVAPDCSCFKFIYPKALAHEEILVNNLKNVDKYIFQIIYLMQEYKNNLLMRNNCVFDIEKDKYTTILTNTQKEIDILMEKMNGDLSPYAWYIEKDIATDFRCCVLKKI